MILHASQWSKICKLADLMQQLFDMPEDSMQVEVTESAVTIKGYSLGSEVTLTIKRKEQN
jgi:hypothetical protein